MIKIFVVEDDMDLLDTIGKSIYIQPGNSKVNLWKRCIRSIVRIFAPLL